MTLFPERPSGRMHLPWFVIRSFLWSGYGWVDWVIISTGFSNVQQFLRVSRTPKKE